MALLVSTLTSSLNSSFLMISWYPEELKGLEHVALIVPHLEVKTCLMMVFNRNQSQDFLKLYSMCNVVVVNEISQYVIS